MRKNYLLLLPLLLLFISDIATAQSPYIFPDSNATWTEFYKKHEDSPIVYHCYGIMNQDTVLNNKTYHKLYRNTDTVFTQANFYGGIRKDQGRVYYTGPETVNRPNKEVIIYDHNLSVGDTINYAKGYNFILPGPFCTVSAIDSVIIGGQWRKRIYFDFPQSIWIEGMGNFYHSPIFTPGTYPYNGLTSILICYFLDHQLLHHNTLFTDCLHYRLQDVTETEQDRFRFYPNPVRGTSTLLLGKTMSQSCVLQLFNATGALLGSYELKGRDRYQLRAADYLPGLYYYRISPSGETAYNGRFIVE